MSMLNMFHADANLTAGCVDAQLLPAGPQRFPPLLPPPAALLPIWGDLGAVLRVPHTPEAVSGLLPSHERNTQ